MNLLRDTAILELQGNVNVLEATLRQTRDRFNVGGSRDVAQVGAAGADARNSHRPIQLRPQKRNTGR